MTRAQALIPEFEQEMSSTRRVLENFPDQLANWKPHPKSNTIGWNANHIAEIPGWVAGVLQQDNWDIQPANGDPVQSPTFGTREELLRFFDDNVAAAKSALDQVADDSLDQPWSLLQGGQVLFTLPRLEVIRTFVLNHLIHHRAILTVYYRLNDIPVPGMYGPSADDANI